MLDLQGFSLAVEQGDDHIMDSARADVVNDAADLPAALFDLARRHRQVRANFERRYQSQADRFRTKLEEFYGKEKAGSIRHAEAFEICEYGRRPGQAELKKLFPFFEQ